MKCKCKTFPEERFPQSMEVTVPAKGGSITKVIDHKKENQTEKESEL